MLGFFIGSNFTSKYTIGKITIKIYLEFSCKVNLCFKICIMKTQGKILWPYVTCEANSKWTYHLGLITSFAFGSEMQFQEQSFPLNSESDNSILGGLGQRREQMPGGREGIQSSDPNLFPSRYLMLGQETCQLVILLGRNFSQVFSGFHV